MRMRVLVVTHNYSIYGASRSLRTMLKPMDENWEIDIAVPKRIIKDTDNRMISKWFNVPEKRIFSFALPFSNIYKGKSKYGFLFSLINNVRWWFQKRKFYKHLNANNYDIIYLNSLTLCKSISEKYPFLIHIREIFDDSANNISQILNKSKGIIFIDDATAYPFQKKLCTQNWILNNPYDMTGINSIKKPKLKIKISDSKKVIFAMIGAITEDKGINYVITTFINSNINAYLLIVGKGEAHFVAWCKKLAKNTPNIIFYGEEENIDNIYAEIDYIVRGEPYECIGRTVYEALYAGCNAIVPSNTLKYDCFFEKEKFQNKIHLYQPRNHEQLTILLNKLANIKILNKTGYSNTAEYYQYFNEITKLIINRNV